MSDGQSGLTFAEHLTDQPVRRGAARGDPRGARVRQVLHRPHGHRRPGRRTRAGTTREVDALRADLPRPRDGGPALRAGDLRGLKAYRHADGVGLDVPPRGQRRADRRAPPRRLALPELARRGLPRSAIEALVARRPGAGCRTVRREEPLPAAVHVRLGGVPRRAPGPRGHLHGDRLPGRGLLPGRGQAGLDLAVHRATPAPAPGGTGAAKCGGNYAASLVAAGRGRRPRLRPGRLPRRRGASLGRGARRHEPLLRATRRPHRHARPLGTILEGVTRSSHPRAGQGAWAIEVEERRISIDEWRDGVRVRRDQRGLRVRHGGRHHAGRAGSSWDGGEVGTDGRRGRSRSR